MVRASKERRTFVTLTLSVVDFRRGRLELTNAGHPPTYLLRDGQAEEIALPSPPLGALGGAFARREVELAPGDIIVWLSDGLFEAGNKRDEPFGYARLRAALEGAASNAAAVRDRLLAAVAHHTAGQSADDDRTMVVMRYRPLRDGAPPRASSAPRGADSS
jgi:sigma-B regulation protein RsbU (phosphoserine phosphatase)